MELLTEAVHLALSDTKRHLRFAFICPEGVTELEIDWRFSPARAGELRTLVTLSLTGPGGFRGAGHRHGDHHQVRLSERQATPGYLPGAIPAGEWTVRLHTHLVVDVTEGRLSVVARTGDTGTPALPDLPALRPLPLPARWMRGDLHCHTVHSDARWTAPELASAAARQGLHFLALTDHNTLSGRLELARSFPGLVLPGLELTTYFGHAVALGIPDYLDWTPLEPQRGMLELARQVWDGGGFLTIAHPFAPGDPICTGCAWTTFDLRPENTTHLEVWNGPWTGRHNERALGCWYELLAAGKRVVAAAGTDAHGPAYLPGSGFTCTPATDDPQVLLAQLRSGTTYLGGVHLDPLFRAPDGPVPLGGEGQSGLWDLELAWSDLRPGSLLHVVLDGEWFTQSLSSAGSIKRQFEVRRWLNLEVRSAAGDLLALTNPVYARQEGAQLAQ